MARLCLLGSLLLVSGLFAQPSNEGSVWGQALYLKPTSPAFPLAQVTTDVTAEDTVQKNFAISRDYGWGFRVGGEFSQCGWFALALSGLYVSTRDPFRVDLDYQGFVFGGAKDLILGFNVSVGDGGTVRSVSTLKGAQSMSHWNVDWGGRTCLRLCRGLVLSPMVGARYVHFGNHISYSAATNFLQNPGLARFANYRASQKLCFDGGGGWVGVSFVAHPFGAGWMRCDFRGLGIIGRRTLSQRAVGVETTNGTPRSFDYRAIYPSSTLMIPGVDAELALGYGICWFGVCWSLEVGYLLQHYWGLYQVPLLAITLTNRSANRDAGIAGPLISLQATY